MIQKSFEKDIVQQFYFQASRSKLNGSKSETITKAPVDESISIRGEIHMTDNVVN